MAQPKFRVGEEVVISSTVPAYADHVGVICTIRQVLSRQDYISRYRTAADSAELFGQGVEFTRSAFGYHVDYQYELVDVSTLERSGVFVDFLGENVLRRHHKPATRSFTELMADPGGRISA